MSAELELLPRATDPGLKRFTHGTHRARSPQETVDRIMGLRRPLGITRVADITGLDVIGVPVTSVYRPNARSLSTAQGKGLSLVAAKASGLMEAAESYHAERITLPLKLASYDELRFTHHVVDPLTLARSRTSTFAHASSLLWIEGWDLIGQRHVWLPYECVHTNFTRPLPPGSGAFSLTSNGLASGNTLLEATSHGICEVIERDANTLWHAIPEQRRWRERRIALETVEDPGCRSVLERFAAANLSVGAWVMTTDVGVCAIACAIVDAEPHLWRLLYATSGLGCHPAPEIALLRALTEAAQCRLTFIAGARDDSDRDIYERARNVEAIARTRRHLVAAPRSTVDFRSLSSHATPTFAGDVAWEVERLRAVGVEQVVVVDLSKRGLDIPVVRVVIPGLEGIHDIPGYLPGPRAQRVLQEEQA